MIYSKQFGFRSNHSTNHAIISLTEHIRQLLDKGHYACGIFIDLEKAFDTVSHNILCNKLEFYGLRGNINRLLQSYLGNRKQYVSLNGIDSEVKDVTCGVPQGSSLGPLLFLLYINDFRFCLSKTSSGHFADDTFIVYNSKKAKTIETIIDTELKHVVEWLALNKLSLNANKTELIFFYSKRHAFNYDNLSIKFCGKKLIPVNHVKYLGMYLDKHLSWNVHIQELSKKLSRANGLLSKLRYNAPFSTCLQVYYAIFYSYLIYGCNVWGLTTKENLDKIEILQKKCVRILNFAPFNSPTNRFFIDMKLLKVRDIINVHQLKLAYDYFTNNLPWELTNLFSLSSEMHTTHMHLNSARKNLFHISKINTETYGNKSIKHHCALLWNETFKNGISINGNPLENKSPSVIKNSHHLIRILKSHYLYKYSLENE